LELLTSALMLVLVLSTKLQDLVRRITKHVLTTASLSPAKHPFLLIKMANLSLELQHMLGSILKMLTNKLQLISKLLADFYQVEQLSIAILSAGDPRHP